MNRKKLITLSVLILIFTCKGISSIAAALESLIPKQGVHEEWALIDGPQTYTKKTLFEHINGQAELFFKYGFQKSVFAIYQNTKGPENQIELDIYDMGNALQAFGIFSRFRNEERPGGIGLDSYLNDHSVFFYKGKYFVMLYATESNSTTLKQLAILISTKILDLSPPPKEIGFFPKDGLKPGSIQYFSEGLLGYKFLKRGFQGIYVEKTEEKAMVKVKAEDENQEYRLFLSIFRNSQEAKGALGIYKNYLTRKGKVISGITTQWGSNGLRGEDPYHRQV
ncbi:MAG: hypothetical protein A2169_15740, partial [Deltaproteobacteria bacterium RBG_13_47_9]